MIETNRIYQGNTLDVLKTFEDDCIYFNSLGNKQI